MEAFDKVKFTLFVCLLYLALASCVPASVLIKDSKVNNNLKAKRSSDEKVRGQSPPAIDDRRIESAGEQAQKTNEKKSLIQIPVPTNDIKYIPQSMLLHSSNEKPAPKKRGINNNQLNLEDFYAPSAYEPSSYGEPGIWGDIIDQPQGPHRIPLERDIDEYPLIGPNFGNRFYDARPASQYHNQISIPVDYPSYRFYGDRKKRSNKLNIPLKRDSLTPADMLALVALVEAGERSRQPEIEAEDMLSNNNAENEYMKPAGSFYPATYELQNGEPGNDENEYGNAWLEPSIIDYYGMPYNLDTIAKYDIPMERDHKYGGNRKFGLQNKRFMVSKKKRSLGNYLN